jgi:hypothetical protein
VGRSWNYRGGTLRAGGDVMEKPTWKRRRVWWFTELQNGQWVWPGTMVEYEQFKIDFAPYMLGSPHTVTHYRMAGSEVLKGDGK